MSAQVALLAGSALMSGMSAMSKIGAGNKTADADQLQALSTDEKASEVEIETAMQEKQRRQEVAKIISTNEGSLGGSGIVGDAGSSYGVIQERAVAKGEEDVQNIRFMGENKRRSLNFQSDQLRRAGSAAQSQGFMGAISGLAQAGMGFVTGGGFGKGG